jgi:hypothetical protein
MMMIEYTSSYGNDWFVIPVELPVGSLTRIASLVVTDTFGVRTLLRPIGDRSLPAANWRMFQHSYLRTAGSDMRGAEPNFLFLAPAIGQSLQGPAVEEVLFMRDEMANMAWAIERRIEAPLGGSIRRDDPAAATAADPAVAATEPEDAPPRYRLATEVPPHWIPLLPVQIPQPGGAVLQRLRRGAVLRPDGSEVVPRALGTILEPGGVLLLHDGEIPREGVRLTRHYQMARWTDGTTVVWAAHRKEVGRGEGSSGLVCDRVGPGEGQ